MRDYGEAEVRLLAARQVVSVIQTLPPPLPGQLEVHDTDIPTLIHTVDATEAQRRVDAFMTLASEVDAKQWFEASGVAVAISLPVQQTREALFQLERSRILEVQGNGIYKLSGAERARRKPIPSPEPVTSLVSPDFARLTPDTPMADLLQNRWAEAEHLNRIGVPRAALIAYGGVLEGALYALAAANPMVANTQSAAPKDGNGRVRPMSSWTLTDLIQVAQQSGWLHSSREQFGKVLRDYRNFVHPREEYAQQVTIDQGMVDMARTVVVTSLQDLVGSAASSNGAAQ